MQSPTLFNSYIDTTLLELNFIVVFWNHGFHLLAATYKLLLILTRHRLMSTSYMIFLTHLLPMHPFPTPMKTSKNRKVFCFQGV